MTSWPRAIAPLLVAVAACAIAAAGCGGKTGGLPDRDPALAHKMVEQEGALLLDVRTPEEFAEGHIEGAVNIPVQELAERFDEIAALTKQDTQHGVVLYCRSGGRAGTAKELFLERGYQKVTNLGGYADW